MSKERTSDFSGDWQAIWMQQSKQFLASANTHLKNLFETNAMLKPEEHFEAIKQWLEMLKIEWKLLALNEEQKAYQKYWKEMMDMSNLASEMMLKEWISRSKKNNPIKNVPELYELWLQCYKKVFEESMQSKSYQEIYSEMMSTHFDFWKNTVTK